MVQRMAPGDEVGLDRRESSVDLQGKEGEVKLSPSMLYVATPFEDLCLPTW